MNMRFVVRTFLSLQRLEVFLAVMLPFFLIVESALANGIVYAGGALHFDELHSWVAFGRGLFFEILTYACAKLTKLLIKKGGWRAAGIASIPGLVALWCVIVSAGNNLGWVINGGEFVGVFASMSRFMPDSFMVIYQAGLGLLLPISVGALALVDTSHLIHEALSNAEMDNHAVQVNRSEMHRTAYLKSQKKQQKTIEGKYDEICAADAEQLVNQVKRGDLSFGTGDLKKAVAQSSVTKVTPVAQQTPTLPPRLAPMSLPQPAYTPAAQMNGSMSSNQVQPPPAPVMPPPVPPQQQGQGIFGKLGFK